MATTEETILSTEKTRAETRKLRAEAALIESQIHLRQAIEIQKMIAETDKARAESRWFPFVAVAGVFAAAAGLLKLLQLV
jgi:hypothetical protein